MKITTIITKNEYEISKRQLEKMKKSLNDQLGQLTEMKDSWADNKDVLIEQIKVNAFQSLCEDLQHAIESYERKELLTE